MPFAMLPTYLLRYLPQKWSDVQLMTDIAEAVGGPFDDWREMLWDLDEAFDPATADADWLDWLMQVVALPTDLDLATARKRDLIGVAFDTWVNKGPASVIEAYVQAATGIAATVTTATPLAFIAGVSMAGDVCGITDAYWHFDVDVPIGSITEAELRRLLIPVVPVFCTYDVTFS